MDSGLVIRSGVKEYLYIMAGIPLTVSNNHTRGIVVLLVSSVVVVI